MKCVRQKRSKWVQVSCQQWVIFLLQPGCPPALAFSDILLHPSTTWGSKEALQKNSRLCLHDDDKNKDMTTASWFQGHAQMIKYVSPPLHLPGVLSSRGGLQWHWWALQIVLYLCWLNMHMDYFSMQKETRNREIPAMGVWDHDFLSHLRNLEC